MNLRMNPAAKAPNTISRSNMLENVTSTTSMRIVTLTIVCDVESARDSRKRYIAVLLRTFRVPAAPNQTHMSRKTSSIIAVCHPVRTESSTATASTVASSPHVPYASTRSPSLVPSRALSLSIGISVPRAVVDSSRADAIRPCLPSARSGIRNDSPIPAANVIAQVSSPCLPSLPATDLGSIS